VDAGTRAGGPGVTEIVEIKGRGHALTIDGGWREVADTTLVFVQRFASATPAQIRSTGAGGSARVPP